MIDVTNIGRVLAQTRLGGSRCDFLNLASRALLFKLFGLYILIALSHLERTQGITTSHCYMSKRISHPFTIQIVDDDLRLNKSPITSLMTPVVSGHLRGKQVSDHRNRDSAT